MDGDISNYRNDKQYNDEMTSLHTFLFMNVWVKNDKTNPSLLRANSPFLVFRE